MDRNVLFYGDNLRILRDEEYRRRWLTDESIDLVYLDPPFKSDQDYNILFRQHEGSLEGDDEAQASAFIDTWTWSIPASRSLEETIQAGGQVAQTLIAFKAIVPESDMLAYLGMMAPRLVELRRVLKPTGAIVLHCDTTASHYLKLLMDAVFGPERFLNEITWKRTTAHNDPKRFGRISDRLLYYSRSAKKKFHPQKGEYSEEQLARYKYTNDEGEVYKAENLTAPHYSKTRTVEWRGTHPGQNRQWRFSTEELDKLWEAGLILTKKDGTPRKDGLIEYLKDAEGAVVQDIWTDIVMAPTTDERLGYQTQKPQALLERIIGATTDPGDVVFDPFCGCGTTVAAAEALGRRWIGIDITHLAIGAIKKRMADSFSLVADEHYIVIGEPTTLAGARELAATEPYQFQWWALDRVGARHTERKKGPDRGIDGRLFFHDEPTGGKTKQIIFSVKGGENAQVSHVRDLVGVLDREKAQIGILITLNDPTSAMKKEAASAGFYKSPGDDKNYARVQLITVEDILAERGPKYPLQGVTNVTFKKAKPQLHPEFRVKQKGLWKDPQSGLWPDKD